MIITSTETIANYTIAETLGVVKGNSVRAKWFGADIGAGFKNLVGGELTAYMDLMEEAREKALERMKADAKSLNADGIVALRFTTSQIAQGAAEILAYGTAVKLNKNIKK